MAPLNDDEFNELEQFLLFDVDTEDVMTLEMADGFLYAIAIGPTTVQPDRWLPKIWGTTEMMPPMDSTEQLDHMLGLVVRYFTGIILGLESHPREVSPYWSTSSYEGSAQEFEDAEAWAFGFLEGMKLCWNDWQPLLSTPQGQSMFRPIGLLGQDDFSLDQDELTRTPGMRAELALQIPQAILDMHAHWLPLRIAVHEREVARSMQARWGTTNRAPVAAARSSRNAAAQPQICTDDDGRRPLPCRDPRPVPAHAHVPGCFAGNRPCQPSRSASASAIRSRPSRLAW